MRSRARTTRLLAAACLASSVAWLVPADAEQSGRATLFDSLDVLEFQLAAPFDDLFVRSERAPDTHVPARLSYLDAASGRRIELDGVEVSVRGNTSRRPTECPFPKLKLRFDKDSRSQDSVFRGARTVKIGTHCDDRPDGQLTFQFGRWPNERSPLREALVYRLLEAAGVAVPRTRLARITYVFERSAVPHTPHPRSITRNALLLEDESGSFARLGAVGELTVPGREPASEGRAAGTFDNAERQFSASDSARVAFAQAMIGNFDWALRFQAGDGYRDDGRLGLWNVLALVRSDGTAFPMLYDFDLSGIVTGRHRWYVDVFPEHFASARSQAAIEVLAQVQRTRSLFDRRLLDETRSAFMTRKAAIVSVVGDSAIDAAGRANAERYLTAFFDAIGTDEEFYRPVVSRTDVVPFSADDRRPSCGPADHVPIGTPVVPTARSGALAQVELLDVFWHWAERCRTVRQGPVWIQAEAIEKTYPSR